MIVLRLRSSRYSGSSQGMTGGASHCDLGRPRHALRLPSPASYTNIPFLVRLAREHAIDAVHPGYGFLSESAEFARRMSEEAGVVVIGPGWEILEQMGDKLQAKALAVRCGAPVLPAMEEDPTAGDDNNNIERIRGFAMEVGYPVMVKAVDGGGGRGIRLVRQESDLQNAVDRARRESPSQTVFVEKAAVHGFHHVEVQVVGDGSGRVRHLWERDCSVQRRFQKIVECAPAGIGDRRLIEKVIDSALRMAREVRLCLSQVRCGKMRMIRTDEIFQARSFSLGTFEFLVNEHLQEFYFLEINPRLQVEHTVTECITGVDLVQTQLLLAQGYSLQQLGIEEEEDDAIQQRTDNYSIQFRLCAEDPDANFALSIGKVTEFVVPTGNGVRVDTNISPSSPSSPSSSPVIVGSDFDNLMAKIIVTATSWEAAVRKARRALGDTKVSGVKTNIDLLRGIVDHEDFLAWRTDTQWLEGHLESLVRTGRAISQVEGPQESAITAAASSIASSASAAPSSTVLFRKGDAWSITLEPLLQDSKSSQSSLQQTQNLPHHLLLRRVLRNEFPSSFSVYPPIIVIHR